MKPLTSDSLGGYIPPWVPNLQEQNSPVSPIFNPFANETIYLPYLIFHGEVAEKTELIWQLKHSGWFFKPYYPQKLFCYNNICPILNIQQKSLPYLSLLNRKFFDIDYIVEYLS